MGKMHWAFLFIILSSIFGTTREECFAMKPGSIHCTNTDSENFIDDINAMEVSPWERLRFLEILVLNSNFSIMSHFPNFRQHSTIFIIKVKVLRMQRCAIETIENGTFNEMHNFQILDLGSNKIRDASFVESLPNTLTELYLNNNEFTIIGDVFRSFTNLFILDLSFCKITALDFNVFAQLSLRTLDLSHNKLFHLKIPASQAEYINLDSNYITDIVLCGNLFNIINLQNNNISHIKGMCGEKLSVAYVNNVNLSNSLNKFSTETFENIIFLKELNLSNNYLPILDKTNLNFDSLIFRHDYSYELDISNSSVSQISSDCFEDIDLEYLNLSNNNLSSTKYPLFRKSHITTLDLTNSQLTQLNNIFSGLYCTNLILCKNQFKLTWESFIDISKVTNIDLTFNKVEIIENYTFKNLDLVMLNISNCNVKKVEVNAFDLLKVEILDLSDNNLEILNQRCFNHILKIRIIHLENNKIKVLQSRTFSNMGTLTEIYLHKNNIRLIESNAFLSLSKLNTLTLTNNSRAIMIEKAAFNQLLSLAELQLMGLSEFDFDVFAKTSVVSSLDLEVSNLTSVLCRSRERLLNVENLKLTLQNSTLPKCFQCLGFLKHLSFVNSKIEVLRNDTFKGLYNLLSLDFTNTTIYNIEPNALNSLFKLKQLDSQNLFRHFKFVGKFMFKHLRSVETLNLSSVARTNDGAFSFSGMDSLRELLLDSNHLTELKNHTFSGLIRLEILDLSRNRLRTLEPSAFSTLKNLIQLLLSNNKLEIIPNSVFGELDALETLDLASNKLRSLHLDSIGNIFNLRQLFLQNNNISEIKIGCFRHLEKLEELNLSRNSISEFKVGVFSNLNSLKVLDISHNGLSELLIDAFVPLKSLVHLNIEKNNLKNLEQKVLLHYLPRLKYFGIAMNKWKCEKLRIMLSAFDQRGVTYQPRTIAPDMASENINGIACIDICNFLLCTEHKHDYHRDII